MLKVLENRLLRRLFGPKRDEVVEDGENCKMKNHNLFSSSSTSIIMKLRMARICSTHENKRYAYKRPLGRPGHSWKVILKWILRT
jgi:hypothetical protein